MSMIAQELRNAFDARDRAALEWAIDRIPAPGPCRCMAHALLREVLEACSPGAPGAPAYWLGTDLLGRIRQELGA